MTRCVLILALLSFGLVGCREPDGEPRYNRNLGSASRPLLPRPGVIVDTSLRANGTGQAIDLPALPEKIPSVDELYSERAESEDEDGAAGVGMEGDVNRDDEADENQSDPDEPESEPDESGVGD